MITQAYASPIHSTCGRWDKTQTVIDLSKVLVPGRNSTLMRRKMGIHECYSRATNRKRYTYRSFIASNTTKADYFLTDGPNRGLKLLKG